MNAPTFRTAVDIQPAEIAEKPAKVLTEAAKRALAEAQERRRMIDEKVADRAIEENGRGGLDPSRYDDWEIGGIAIDF